MSNIIKKIELDLGKKQITLTTEQAQKLKDALNELFGVKEEHIHHHDYYPTWPYRPYYWQYGTGYQEWGDTVVTYSASNGTATLSLSDATATVG